MHPQLRELASGLRFPEGPIAFEDGSVVLVEIARGTLSRVPPGGGRVEVVGRLGGGPNGAALGPDGACYVCNNGGLEWREEGGLLFAGNQPAGYSGGRIERVDLATGRFDVLYDSCDGRPLRSPNDIVFDAHGGFWFTDLGQGRTRDRDRGGVYYATADGASIREAIYPLETPNGIGLSPDGSLLYVAETITGRLLAFELAGPGELLPAPRWPQGRLVARAGGPGLFDSLALEADGRICVATLVNGGITVASPDGRHVEHHAMPDPQTTNICFGGTGHGTAFVTLSASGRLVSLDWPRPGLPLSFTMA
jgi:gluconolactonase